MDQVVTPPDKQSQTSPDVGPVEVQNLSGGLTHKEEPILGLSDPAIVILVTSTALLCSFGKIIGFETASNINIIV